MLTDIGDPLVMTDFANWKITISNGYINYELPFSIAMLYSLPEGKTIGN